MQDDNTPPGEYGNIIQAASLANTSVSAQQYSSTVIFKNAGSVSSVTKYIVGNGAGYAAGTGGSIQYLLETDNGNGFPSGTIVGQTVVQKQDASWNGGMQTVAFTSPVSVQAGVEYHLVAVNRDANPGANYVGEDDLYNGAEGDGGVPNQFMQPGQFQVLVDSGSGWRLRPGFTAIEQFTFTDGSQFGQGYMEMSSTINGGGKGHTVSGSQMVGENFTVSSPSMQTGTLTVSVDHLSGTSPLTASILSNGQVVATATENEVLPIDTVKYVPYGAGWATFNLPATLQQGQTYQLQFSAPSDSNYQITAVRDGQNAGYGFAGNTVFSDGFANFNSGSGWTTGWDTWNSPPIYKDQDLSFFFQPGAGPPPPPVVTPDQLNLIMQQSSGKNAQFIVKVDGTQVGGRDTITARAGQTQSFDFSGTWGTGQHSVEIDLANPTKNKTMTVDQVSYDKTQYLSAPHDMTNSSTIFTLTVGQ